MTGSDICMHNSLIRHTQHKTRSKILQIVPIILFFVLISFWPILTTWNLQPHGELQIWVMDVGQGDAILIRTKEGKKILVDGGRDQMILQKLGSVMWPWDKTIDAIVATHPDADHITGLISVLKRYHVNTIYETGVRGETPMIDALAKAIPVEHATHTLLRSGDAFDFGDAHFIVEWPTQQGIDSSKNTNNTSVVLKLVYGSRSILLTGDAEKEVEDVIGSKIGDVDVLKVGHHGSVYSTTPNFLAEIKPEYALISDGVNNPYGHPHPVVLDRLRAVAAKIFRTDLDGDILVTTDGTYLRVKPTFLPF